MMHIVCYLRQGSNVFETYWTTIRGVEAMDNSYRLLDLTVYGRQETLGSLFAVQYFFPLKLFPTFLIFRQPKGGFWRHS
jgi:hypothetical protein